mmetsp:Transcript_10114/g.20490  ORF Transcript_10114/g.20490 Transcript_10114/m.20490 type:complete len:873 (+) Transcript_10114:53-2671(+)
MKLAIVASALSLLPSAAGYFSPSTNLLQHPQPKLDALPMFTPIAAVLFPVDGSMEQERRSLTVDCTPYENLEPPGFGVYEETPDMAMTALNSLKDFRGEGGPWYEKILNAFMIVMCEDKAPEASSDRYVECTEPNADTHKQAADFDGGALCEVKPNCYWDKIANGEDRARVYTDEDVAQAEKDVEEYAISVGKYLGGPIALAVLNFIGTGIYFIFRCICRLRCCGARPREKPYQSFEILLPIFFYTVFAFAMIGTGSQANNGNNKVTVALDRIFDTVNRGATDLQFFFGTAGRPIGGVADVVSDAVTEVSTIIDGTEWITMDMNAISRRFVAFSTTYSATLSAAGADAELNSVIANLDSTVGPITDSVNELLGTLETELVDVEDFIQEGAQSALDQLQSMNETIADLKSSLDSFKKTNENISDLRKAGVLAIFAIALVFVFLGFIGVLSAFTPCKFDDYLEFLLHFTWVFGSFIGTLTFIIGGLALVASIGWSDMCQFMDLVKDDFSLLGEQAGTGLDACYNDTALIAAFNMTKSLDFAGPIEEQLSSVTDMDIAADFAAIKQPINDLATNIKAISIQTGVDALNAMTNLCATSGATACTAGTCGYSQTYTAANIMTPWADNSASTMAYSGHSFARSGSETPVQYITRLYDSSPCETLASGAFTNSDLVAAFTGLYDTEVAKTSMLRDLGDAATCSGGTVCPTAAQKNSTTILGALDAYEAKMNTLMDDFANMGNNMVGDLITNVEDFTCNMRCGFLATFMDELQDVWCLDLLSGFLDISLSLVLLAFFNIPVCICAAILANRFRGKWRVNCGTQVFAGADEGGRAIGKGKYAEAGTGDEVEGGGDGGGGEVEMQADPSVPKEEQDAKGELE